MQTNKEPIQRRPRQTRQQSARYLARFGAADPCSQQVGIGTPARTLAPGRPRWEGRRRRLLVGVRRSSKLCDLLAHSARCEVAASGSAVRAHCSYRPDPRVGPRVRGLFPFVARPATGSRLLLWSPAAPEQKSRNVADRAATRLVVRECRTRRSRVGRLLEFLSCDTESGVDDHFRFELLALAGREGCKRQRACTPPHFADEDPCRSVGSAERRARRGSRALGDARHRRPYARADNEAGAPCVRLRRRGCTVGPD